MGSPSDFGFEFISAVAGESENTLIYTVLRSIIFSVVVLLLLLGILRLI